MANYLSRFQLLSMSARISIAISNGRETLEQTCQKIGWKMCSITGEAANGEKRKRENHTVMAPAAFVPEGAAAALPAKTGIWKNLDNTQVHEWVSRQAQGVPQRKSLNSESSCYTWAPPSRLRT